MRSSHPIFVGFATRVANFVPRVAKEMVVEFYLYPTVGTVLIHSIKPELSE